MTLYEKNVSTLMETYLEFPEKLLQESTDGVEVTLSPARNGDTTASFEGISLHSRFDPSREARQLIESLTVTGCTVFFGFGLGYYVEEFHRRYPDNVAVIVEPNPEILRAALGARDLSTVLSSKNSNLLLDVEPDAVAAFFSSLPPVALNIVAPKSLIRLNEKYFIRLQSVIDSFEARREINKNTLSRFGRRWIRNLVGNLHLLPTAKPLGSLEGRFSGMPALLLAAGPSLDSILPSLTKIAERCVVIAVDTSLRAIMRAGVHPDFLVVVDPQYWNARHLDGCTTGELCLITESATYPAVFRNSYRSVFFGDSLFPLGNFLERDLGPFGKLGAGGSVATSAWDVARLLGCTPLYSAGLDLGFPGRGTHFKGSRFEEMQLNEAGRLCPAETGSHRMLNDAAPFYVESNSGGRVLTDKRLISYKWWFENQIKMYPEMITYNLSLEGVKIEGMPYRSTTSLHELPILSDKEARFTTGQPVGEPVGGDSRERILKNAVQSLVGELKELMALAATAENLSRDLQKATPEDLAGILTSLNQVDMKLLSSSAKDVAGFLVQNLAHRIIESAQTATNPVDVGENSRRMYGELEEAAEYHIGLLERATFARD